MVPPQYVTSSKAIVICIFYIGFLSWFLRFDTVQCHSQSVCGECVAHGSRNVVTDVKHEADTFANQVR